MNYFLKKFVEIIYSHIKNYEQLELSRKFESHATFKKIIIGNSARIRNRQNDKNQIIVGDGSVIEGELFVMGYGGKIVIGENTYIGEYSRIWSGDFVTIGNDVLISHNVNIMDTNSHNLNYAKRAEDFKRLLKNGPATTNNGIKCKSIVIGDNVWINFNSTVLKGVRIGKGTIIGPNSVVINDLPSFVFAAGNPAKIIKKIE